MSRSSLGIERCYDERIRYLILTSVEYEKSQMGYLTRQIQHRNIEETASSRRVQCYANWMVGGAGRGYMPLQGGRTPEGSLNGGLASGEGNVRTLLG